MEDSGGQDHIRHRRISTPAVMVHAGVGQQGPHLQAALGQMMRSSGENTQAEESKLKEDEKEEENKRNKNMMRRMSSADAPMFHIGAPGNEAQFKQIDKMVNIIFEKSPREYLDNHAPRDLFVQMNELEGAEWVEQARWIKYEEVVEKGSERWGRPHISTLTFHSLINLKLCLESGVMLLDLESRDLSSVAFSVVESLHEEGLLDETQQAEVLRVLLLRHKVVTERGFALTGIRRSKRQRPSFTGSLQYTNQGFVTSNDGTDNSLPNRKIFGIDIPEEEDEEGSPEDDDNSRQFKRGSIAQGCGIMQCLKGGTEGTLSLVGPLEGLDRPIAAFVRLAEAVVMPNALEVLLPVRFVFILLTPVPAPNIDFHEVGRSFSTLMSNPMFQVECYKMEERSQLLSAINMFLDESVVLPPGDFESNNLLSIQEIQQLRKRRQKKKQENAQMVVEVSKEKAALQEQQKSVEVGDKYGDPLVRTNVPFGGLINDVRRRYPWYWSDIKDGLNIQCLSAIIFIYFACLSPAIAFGGLYGDKTDNLIGIPVTLMVTCAASIFFALFSGNPLVIVGCTGPLMLFDEALFGFAKSNEMEFLPWRVWTSFWLVIVALVVAGFQGSTLVRHFTKFTKDIFASLVSLIFIFEALKKLYDVFQKHPLTTLDVYCNASIETTIESINNTLYDHYEGKTFHLVADELFGNISKISTQQEPEKIQPNAALLSFIIMFCTFIIAYGLKIFRNGKYLGRTVRRSLGDFGVPIAIVVMVTIDYLMDDTYTQKLKVPAGLEVTAPDQRGWIISPMGIHKDIPVWAPFGAVIPAVLLYLLLFMETQICELLMLEKATKKGGGLHLDIVLLSFINVFAAVIGGPFICAATVRAVSHVAALSVMSTTHAPGESAKLVGVIDQRMSPFFVGVMIGMSVLLAPVLQLIPYPVLFGVFIYMGVSAIYGGIQFFDRVFLLFKPVKYHPQVSYVRRVKTWKMHMFTGFQALGLAILWTVMRIKQISLFFPFFVVGMIPLRLSLKFFYTPRELDALDGPKAGQTIKDDEPDFYDIAYGN